MVAGEGSEVGGKHKKGLKGATNRLTQGDTHQKARVGIYLWFEGCVHCLFIMSLLFRRTKLRLLKVKVQLYYQAFLLFGSSCVHKVNCVCMSVCLCMYVHVRVCLCAVFVHQNVQYSACMTTFVRERSAHMCLYMQRHFYRLEPRVLIVPGPQFRSMVLECKGSNHRYFENFPDDSSVQPSLRITFSLSI